MKQMLEWTKTLIKPHTFAFFNDTFHWWIHRHVHVYDQITWKIKENKFSIIKSIYLNYPCTGASKSLQSCLTLCDPWTVAHQAPPSMGFSRQEYWSVLPFPSPGDLPNPGIKPASPTSLALAGRFFTTGATRKVLYRNVYYIIKSCHMLALMMRSLEFSHLLTVFFF